MLLYVTLEGYKNTTFNSLHRKNDELWLFKKQRILLEVFSSSEIEGANTQGMVKLADKLDLKDWFYELKKKFPHLYDEVFNDWYLEYNIITTNIFHHLPKTNSE